MTSLLDSMEIQIYGSFLWFQGLIKIHGLVV